MGVLESEPPADRSEKRIIEIETERLRDFREHCRLVKGQNDSAKNKNGKRESKGKGCNQFTGCGYLYI